MIAVRSQGLVADDDNLAKPSKAFIGSEGTGIFRCSQRKQMLDCGPEGGFCR